MRSHGASASAGEFLSSVAHRWRCDQLSRAPTPIEQAGWTRDDQATLVLPASVTDALPIVADRIIIGGLQRVRQGDKVMVKE